MITIIVCALSLVAVLCMAYSNYKLRRELLKSDESFKRERQMQILIVELTTNVMLQTSAAAKKAIELLEDIDISGATSILQKISYAAEKFNKVQKALAKKKETTSEKEPKTPL